MQRPVASFTLTREHRRIAGQVTARSANLINACKSSQHLLPVSKTHKPRCLQHLLEDGSDPQQQLAVGVCCVCKATFFPQPPPPALRESKHRPRRKLTQEQNTQDLLAGLNRCFFPKQHPSSIRLPESHEGAAESF